MKKLLLITTLLGTLSASAACELTLSLKKDGAKTAYAANGVSISSKIREALSTQCSIKYRVMTKEEIKKMDIERLQKRLSKLQAK